MLCDPRGIYIYWLSPICNHKSWVQIKAPIFLKFQSILNYMCIVAQQGYPLGIPQLKNCFFLRGSILPSVIPEKACYVKSALRWREWKMKVDHETSPDLRCNGTTLWEPTKFSSLPFLKEHCHSSDSSVEFKVFQISNKQLSFALILWRLSMSKQTSTTGTNPVCWLRISPPAWGKTARSNGR